MDKTHATRKVKIVLTGMSPSNPSVLLRADRDMEGPNRDISDATARSTKPHWSSGKDPVATINRLIEVSDDQQLAAAIKRMENGYG
jgi:hypothetical protein